MRRELGAAGPDDSRRGATSPNATPVDADHALVAFFRGERVAVLATLIRDARGDFDAAEDALAEATSRAVERWRAVGVPDRPGAWMLTAARRILIDRARRVSRNDVALDAEQHASAIAIGETAADTTPADTPPTLARDDRLTLLFTCCHPSLSRPAQLALALRTIGGLSTREIARAFLEPEATTAQRLVRATRKIRDARVPYRVPSASELPSRLDVAREALYLVFNEGYGATAGDVYLRDALADDAIRLARLVVTLTPDDPESLGLLALMLLHHARGPARLDATGAIVPLEEQDRTRWIRTFIREGEHLLDRAIARQQAGPYQLQAAISALHDTSPTAAATDWRQIALLYGELRLWIPTPVVELNAAVALAMVHGPDWGLAQLDALVLERGMAEYHLLPAARADLLRRAGRYEDAAFACRDAIRLARSRAERLYLERRLAEVEAAAARDAGPQELNFTF